MEVNTGKILAMASYPAYDLNDTRNTQALIGMPVLDEEGKKNRGIYQCRQCEDDRGRQ